MSDVGYSGVADWVNTSLGSAPRLSGGNALPSSGVGGGGVGVLPNYVRDTLRILASFGTDTHVYLPGSNGVAVSGLPTNNYTLSDGSTGYSAVDGTAGRVLDGAGSVGSELINQSLFAAGDAGALVSANASAVTVTNNDPTAAFTTAIGGPLVVGKTYKASWNLNAKPASGNARILCGGYDSGNTIVAGASFVFITASSTAALILSNGGSSVNGESSSWSSVSLIEVTGIHATQATTANKPALRRGLLNLIQRSNDLTSTTWNKNAANGLSGKITETATTDFHSVNQAFTAVAGVTYTAAAILKAAERGYAFLGLNGGGVGAVFASINLSTGAISAATGSPSSITTESLGDGYWIATLSATASSSVSMPIDVRISADGVWSNRVYAGTADSGVLFNGAGLFQGTLTAQQILAEGGIPLTTSAAASNSGAGRYSWQFDGTNDSLALGSVPFQAADDHAVVHGLSCTSKVASGRAVHIGSGGDTPRVACTGVNAATGFFGAAWRDDAATLVNIADAVDHANGIPFVGSARKVGNVRDIRVNGTQAATNTTALGTTTLTAAAIGVHTAGGSNFLGSIGPVILIKGTISDSDLLTLERWVASLTPNGPTF